MNRREFTASLTALVAAPTIPVPTASASAPLISTPLLATAKLMARTHNACSPEMLSRLMRIEIDSARLLHKQLFDSGVITHSNGLAMATKPLNTHCIPNEALKPTNLAQKAYDLKQKAKRLREVTDRLAKDDPDRVLKSESDKQIDRHQKSESDTA